MIFCARENLSGEYKIAGDQVPGQNVFYDERIAGAEIQHGVAAIAIHKILDVIEIIDASEIEVDLVLIETEIADHVKTVTVGEFEKIETAVTKKIVVARAAPDDIVATIAFYEIVT